MRRSGTKNQGLPVDTARFSATAPSQRVSRVARLMALRCISKRWSGPGQFLVTQRRPGLARSSRARLSQIVSLVQLAPDLQEQLLFLKWPAHGREPLPLRHMLAVAAVLDCHEQRRRWRKLQQTSRARAAR